MGLEPGTKIGSYEIVSAIGAGGMGEVYRARDDKLRRDVAIKVLPADLVDDEERRARFLREARASAAVNHPYIATIHEVGEADGLAFIAMELVDGQPLRSLLRKGGMPVQEVLRIGSELAEGLAHAHACRVLHRDLKPENIIVRKDGHPKILDFGLAKLLEKGDPLGEPVVSGLETVSAAMTLEGRIMGTPAYMSPEQARGDALDARSDIFSLGCVIYEMAAGLAPFDGRSALEILGAIVRDRPATPSDMNASVPVELDRIIGKCLEKAPEDRYQHAEDLAVDLRVLRRHSSSGSFDLAVPSGGLAAPRRDSVPSLAGAPGFGPKRWAPYLAIVLLAGAGIGWWISRSLSTPAGTTPGPVRQFEVDIGKALPLYDWTIVSQFALSPDGRRLAYIARTGESSLLYVRGLDEIQATAIPGTENALAPFFSPDGKWIAYYLADPAGHENKLVKVPVDGGPPQVLCDAWPPSGGTWLPGGRILFASTEPFTNRPIWDGSVRWGLSEIGDGGGTPRLVTTVNRAAEGEAAHGLPHVLPGGRAVLFTIRRTGGDWAKPEIAGAEPDWSTESSDVALLDPASGEYHTLIKNASAATYSPSGHILFMRGSDLWAAPFDITRLAVTGSARVVRQHLQAMRYPTLNVPYAIDNDGSAVFLPAAEVSARQRSLVWVDRKGGREAAQVPPANRIETPRVSPDGERILYVVQAANGNIWVHERSRPGSRIRLTFDDTDARYPVWFPDSRHFLYALRGADERSPIGYFTTIHRFRADGAGSPELWARPNVDVGDISFPMVVLADGRTVLYQEGGSPRTLWDVADSSRPKGQRYIVQTPALDEDPVLSKDGRWLAYSSLESGSSQIYVCPYPDTQSARWQVTSEGGAQPLWSPDGSELYYRAGSAMMAVPIRTRPTFQAGTPVKLFEGDFLNPGGHQRDYDLEYPAGKRFLMVEEVEPEVQDTKLVFVQNWNEELDKLVPPGSP